MSTGPGGCGTRRLAIELGRGASEGFSDGVHFASVAEVRDPALVPVSIARGIAPRGARGTSLRDHLSGFLGLAAPRAW